MAKLILPHGTTWEFVEVTTDEPFGPITSVKPIAEIKLTGFSTHGVLREHPPLCPCEDCVRNDIDAGGYNDVDVHAAPLSPKLGNPRNPCVIAKAAMVRAADEGHQRPWEMFGDRPAWINQVVRAVGIAVNDSAPEEARSVWERLNDTIPRVVKANKLDDEHIERRINARLLCWFARRIIGDPLPADVEAVVFAREAWIRGDTTDTECLYLAKILERGGGGNHELLGVAAGLIIVTPAVIARAVLNDAARGDATVYSGVELFEDLLDQWEKACAEEGVLGVETRPGIEPG